MPVSPEVPIEVPGFSCVCAPDSNITAALAQVIEFLLPPVRPVLCYCVPQLCSFVLEDTVVISGIWRNELAERSFSPYSKRTPSGLG